MSDQKKDWTAEPLSRGRNYFLLSDVFVKALKLPEGTVSKPVTHRILVRDLFIAAVTLNELEKVYEEAGQPAGFWAREVQLSTESEARIKYVTPARCKKNNLFRVIEMATGATNEKNVACVIGSIAKYQGLTPIELFNEVSEAGEDWDYKKYIE